MQCITWALQYISIWWKLNMYIFCWDCIREEFIKLRRIEDVNSAVVEQYISEDSSLTVKNWFNHLNVCVCVCLNLGCNKSPVSACSTKKQTSEQHTDWDGKINCNTNQTLYLTLCWYANKMLKPYSMCTVGGKISAEITPHKKKKNTKLLVVGKW